MKKLILVLVVVLMVFVVQVQDGKKVVCKVLSVLGVFNLDFINNKEKLQEVIDFIEEGVLDLEILKEAKIYLIKGEIYNEIVNQYLIVSQFGDMMAVKKFL